MTLLEFKDSLSRSTPPALQRPALAALWWAAKNDWDKAHELVMNESGADCAWVHAYLHRLEGDLPNARYWYREAGKPVADGPLATEWDALADAMLSGPPG